MATVLQAQKLTKTYGTKVLFENLDLNINEGEKVALIAPNGTGKSSLLKIIAGADTPDLNDNGESGTIQIFSSGGVAFLDQEPVFDNEKTLFEEVFSGGGEITHITAQYEKALKGSDHSALERAINEMDRVKGWQFELKIKQILTSLKIESLELKMGQLSGGQKKRVALAKMMIQDAGFIIMDEPTNHLDLEIIEFLEDYLKRSRVTLLMVTHDRYFLDRVCNKIIELESGKLYTYEGNYTYFLKKREERIENFNTETERARNLFHTELEWMRRMPQARTTKAKYRINAFYDLKERAGQRVNNDNIRINTASSRLGTKIINCKNISHSFGPVVTIDEFTYNFTRGEKIGIVGVNGVGKSTFLDVITGAIPATKGETEWGETVVFGYYRQTGLEFKAEDKVIDIVREIAETVTMSDGSTISVSQFLTRFLFPHSMHNMKVEKLSGGERRRLYLVTVLMKNPNFLILDEPTNDLDLMSINVLEEYLETFNGCVIIVSHDRYFLDKIAGHLFVFEGNGVIKDFVGKYSEYREYMKDKERIATKELKAGQSVENREPSDIKSGSNQKRKLSFKEQQEFNTLEREIGELEKEKSSLEAALNSGTLSSYELTQASVRFSALLSLIDSKSERWLELSDI
jgi:ATP-binding cassette subfamily F protein uup